MKQIQNLLAKLRCQKGQGTVEYALIVAAIVLIITVVLVQANSPLQQAISGAFLKAANAINAA